MAGQFTFPFAYLSAVVNALLICGYTVTWVMAIHYGHYDPEIHAWGEIQGNHGPWRQWGFRDVFHWFLLLPCCAFICACAGLKELRRTAVISLFGSVILFFVALEHYWLID